MYTDKCRWKIKRTSTLYDKFCDHQQIIEIRSDWFKRKGNAIPVPGREDPQGW
jgi:hypothetical protein